MIDNISMKRYEQELISKSQAKALSQYKRRLLIQIIFLFLFCLFLLLERVFYPLMQHSQQQFLKNIQQQTHLVTIVDGQVTPSDILHPFFRFWALLSNFNIQFLILTHVFITMYVIMDSAISSKVIIVTFAIIQGLTFLQLLYSGGRPGWSSDIYSSQCLQSFSHPDVGSVLIVFVPSYAYFCWKKKFSILVHSYRNRCNNFSILGMFFAIVLVYFLNYITGNIYLLNIGLSLLLFLFFFVMLTFLDNKINQGLTGLNHRDTSKSYQTKWVFFIIFIALFIEMTYANANPFRNIEWIKSQIACKKYTGQQIDFINYDKIIGAWFNFKQTAVCFAWIGFVLAFPLCQQKMKSRSWNHGTIKARLFNILICNILIAPSWLFQLFLKDEGGWMKDIGINAFVVDAIHYFLLYLWLFGFVPYLILKQVFRTVEQLDYETIPEKLSSE